MPMVRSAARAARILRVLFLTPEGKRLSELSEELGLNKTTALRLLRTLMAEGVVVQEGRGGRFRLDPMSWLTVVARVPSVYPVAAGIKNVLRSLAEETGSTAVLELPVVAGRTMVATMWAEPERPLRVDPARQAAVPMHAVAGGKCYLASLGEAELQAWLKGPLPGLTPHTVTSPEGLAVELSGVRRQGYAVDREESALGCSGLAVPVSDGRGGVLAALCLTTPAGEMTGANIARWLPRLRTASEAISHALRLDRAVENREQPRGPVRRP
jgi:IclR family acetate operon transcriptional repressor